MSDPKQLSEKTIKTTGKKAEDTDEKDEDEKNEKYDENDKLEDGLHGGERENEDKLHGTSLHEKL